MTFPRLVEGAPISFPGIDAPAATSLRRPENLVQFTASNRLNFRAGMNAGLQMPRGGILCPWASYVGAVKQPSTASAADSRSAAINFLKDRHEVAEVWAEEVGKVIDA